MKSPIYCRHVSVDREVRYGGVCQRCGRILCIECLGELFYLREFSLILDWDRSKGKLLDPFIVRVLKSEGEVSGRVLIHLCGECIEELEGMLLDSYVGEDLPLLINHVWYSFGVCRRYRQRLAVQ